MTESFDFKKWEAIAILMSICVFVLNLFIYLGKYTPPKPIAKFLGQISDEPSDLPIGAITVIAGGVQRKKDESTIYEKITNSVNAFESDVVVTGPGAQAVIQLNDQSEALILSENSMIILSFEKSYQIDGVYHRPKIKIIKGTVEKKTIAVNTIQTIKKVETPAPELPVETLKARVLSPDLTKELVIVGTINTPVNIQIETSKPSVQTLIRIKDVQTGTAVLESPQKSEAARLSVSFSPQKPGAYMLEIEDLELGNKSTKLKSDPILSSPFSVSDLIDDSIATLPPLVGGKLISSNQVYSSKKSKDFSVLLRWKPISGVKKYTVNFLSSEESLLPKLKATTGLTRMLVPKKLGAFDSFKYRIEAQTDSGFKLTSKVMDFHFDFLPPKLTNPTPEQTYKFSSDQRAHNVILTWTKTNFTEDYVVEISTDPSFKTVFLKRQLRVNLCPIKDIAEGIYYWRVASRAGALKSDFSKSRKFIVLK